MALFHSQARRHMINTVMAVDMISAVFHLYFSILHATPWTRLTFDPSDVKIRIRTNFIYYSFDLFNGCNVRSLMSLMDYFSLFL